MHTITTNGKSLILVEVPIEAKEISLGAMFIRYRGSDGLLDIIHPEGEFQLSDKYKILGTLTNGVPDFDVEPYVERLGEGFKNYMVDNASFALVQYAFLSLLQSHSIPYADKKIIILEKK